MQTPMLVIAIGLLFLVAHGDVYRRRIPNTLSLGLAALGASRLALAGDPTDAVCTLAAAALVFAAGFLLFWRGVFGGGDAKLVSGMVLLVGHRQLLDFLVLMSLCGGILALSIIARDAFRGLSSARCNRQPTAAAEASKSLGKSTVPYGVAIATAGVIMLMLAV